MFTGAQATFIPRVTHVAFCVGLAFRSHDENLDYFYGWFLESCNAE